MPAVDKKAFGRRVKRRRDAIGLTQDLLAEACGMSQQGVDNIESGKVERPRKLMELATSLQTTQKWLLFEEGPELLRAPNQRAEIQSQLQGVDDDQLGVIQQLLKTLAERKPEVA